MIPTQPTFQGSPFARAYTANTMASEAPTFARLLCDREGLPAALAASLRTTPTAASLAAKNFPEPQLHALTAWVLRRLAEPGALHSNPAFYLLHGLEGGAGAAALGELPSGLPGGPVPADSWRFETPSKSSVTFIDAAGTVTQADPAAAYTSAAKASLQLAPVGGGRRGSPARGPGLEHARSCCVA